MKCLSCRPWAKLIYSYHPTASIFTLLTIWLLMIFFVDGIFIMIECNNMTYAVCTIKNFSIIYKYIGLFI